MSTAPSLDYDLFISYAHVDNAPLLKGQRGWVSALKERLEQHLSQKLGRKDYFRIWHDDADLHGHHNARVRIPDELRKSRLLLLVLSTGYVESKWCTDELEAFAQRHAGDLQERIFTVELAPLQSGLQVPGILRDLRKYQFWTIDDNKRPRTYALPVAQAEDREYWKQVDDLTADIAGSVLERRGREGDGAIAPRSGGGGAWPQRERRRRDDSNGAWRAAAVLLAEVTADIQPRSDEVRRFLQQAGVKVLPEGSYPRDFEGLNQAVAGDLRQAALFVQVLGNTPDDLVAIAQYEAARRARLPILQWRSNDLQVETIDSPVWRALLALSTVRAEPIEDFKQAILKEWSRLTAPPPPPAALPFLLINASPIDLEHAYRIQDALPSVESEVWVAGPDARAGQLDSDIKDKTVGCDAIVVVYGKADPEWVGAQMKQVRKYSVERDRPPRLTWVVCGPPEPKERLRVRLHAWETRSMEEALASLPDALR